MKKKLIFMSDEYAGKVAEKERSDKMTEENKEKLGKEELVGEITHAFACSVISRQATDQLKALIEGKVSDEFVEKWISEFCQRFSTPAILIPYRKYIKQLLEDYYKELMK